LPSSNSIRPSNGIERKRLVWARRFSSKCFLPPTIVRFPQAWHPLGEGVRRCRLSRFQYGLIYTVENGDILVLAVAHLHRRPDYWRDRLNR
jgi:hypothetical protein